MKTPIHPLRDFAVEDCGFMYVDYFSGRSADFYDEVVCGYGSSPYDALDDALNMAAEMGWIVDPIENDLSKAEPHYHSRSAPGDFDEQPHHIVALYLASSPSDAEHENYYRLRRGWLVYQYTNHPAFAYMKVESGQLWRKNSALIVHCNTKTEAHWMAAKLNAQDAARDLYHHLLNSPQFRLFPHAIRYGCITGEIDSAAVAIDMLNESYAHLFTPVQSANFAICSRRIQEYLNAKVPRSRPDARRPQSARQKTGQSDSINLSVRR